MMYICAVVGSNNNNKRCTVYTFKKATSLFFKEVHFMLA